ncbi:hypothetical protein QU870_27410, partial [Escherichia coli]|nr:hypothetical protein [Escherichia coli]
PVIFPAFTRARISPAVSTSSSPPLPVPGIFFDYLKAVQLPGDKRPIVQSSFERLCINKRRDDQRFYFARIAEEPGNCARYKTVKGYLVKGRSLMHESKLKDSPYLFIS